MGPILWRAWVAIMEVLLPVILNVCRMLLKAKFGLDSAESYLIALMGVLSLFSISAVFLICFYRRPRVYLWNTSITHGCEPFSRSALWLLYADTKRIL